MNIHLPERQPNETFSDYKERRKVSKLHGKWLQLQIKRTKPLKVGEDYVASEWVRYRVADYNNSYRILKRAGLYVKGDAYSDSLRKLAIAERRGML